MRALALDIGETRVGVAVSDPQGRIATPVCVLPAAAATGLPLEFEDERLSSAEAKRILREQGLSEKSMRGKVDMVAASLFLQAWLDARQA